MTVAPTHTQTTIRVYEAQITTLIQRLARADGLSPEDALLYAKREVDSLRTTNHVKTHVGDVKTMTRAELILQVEELLDRESKLDQLTKEFIGGHKKLMR